MSRVEPGSGEEQHVGSASGPAPASEDMLTVQPGTPEAAIAPARMPRAMGGMGKLGTGVQRRPRRAEGTTRSAQ